MKDNVVAIIKSINRSGCATGKVKRNRLRLIPDFFFHPSEGWKRD